MPYDPAQHPDEYDYTNASAPARKGAVIDKSDTVDMAEYAKALYCTVSGDLKFLPVGNLDADPLTIPVYAGQVVPWQTRRVFSSVTTATVLAMYD